MLDEVGDVILPSAFSHVRVNYLHVQKRCEQLVTVQLSLTRSGFWCEVWATFKSVRWLRCLTTHIDWTRYKPKHRIHCMANYAQLINRMYWQRIEGTTWQISIAILDAHAHLFRFAVWQWNVSSRHTLLRLSLRFKRCFVNFPCRLKAAIRFSYNWRVRYWFCSIYVHVPPICNTRLTR